MGRKPAPAALKLLQGRTPTTDSGGRKVVQLPFRRVPPRKPADLTPEASKHWDALVDELARMQLLKPIDIGSLTMLCEIWSRWQLALEQIKKEGIFSENSQGRVRHPAVMIAQDAEKAYRSFASEFGLTPSAEGRLHPKEADSGEDNPFE